MDEAELERYEVEAKQVTWVGCDRPGAETLRWLLRRFQGLAAGLAADTDEGARRLMVGIDTEWGDKADQVDALTGGGHAAPAVMQLAVHYGHSQTSIEADPSSESEPEAETRVVPAATWVIDCGSPSPELRELTSWLLGLPSPDQGGTAAETANETANETETEPAGENFSGAPMLIGFAFAHDIARLLTLSGHDTPATAANPKVMDLQRVAMEFAYGQSGSAASLVMNSKDKSRWNTPGLGLVCAAFLRKRLDKTEQCSDWDQRPLIASQIAYAAADAAVLLEIAAAMGVTGR